MLALNIVIDIIFIDLSRGKSFEVKRKLSGFIQFSSIAIDRTNLVTTENAPWLLFSRT